MGFVNGTTIFLFSPADADTRTNPVIVLVATLQPLLTYMVWDDHIAFDDTWVTENFSPYPWDDAGWTVAPPGWPCTWTYYPRDWATAQLWPATRLDLGRQILI